MKYYFANLAVHLLITIILIILIVITTNRNRKRKTKHTLTYFLPFMLTAVTIFHAYTCTAPRLLDIKGILEENFYSYSGTIEEVSALRNSVVIDGKSYYTSPLYDIPEVGTPVRIKYTKYGNYMVEIAPGTTEQETETRAS
ncbi:MAG: hypothetical protein IKN14_07510 [Clostridiales bacterium]|nr:hypothetical protein [Clostridiales bacterium]